jgi:hypothetical protein
LEPLGAAVLTGESETSWGRRYGPIVRMLYSIGFIGVASSPRRNPTFFLTEPNALKFERQIEAIDSYFVARAYHSALEVQTSDQQQSI